MSTTYVTAASTLDASINRLKHIKAEAQIYHNHQIAEAQHLSVEALRVSNDAKLAADRVEAMKKTLSLFHLERRIKDTVQQKEKIQTRLILIAPTVEEELQAPAAEVRKEDPPTSLVTPPTIIKEQPNRTVIEEELAKDNPVKNEPVKEVTALQEFTKNDTIEEQSTQEESMMVDTACEEEVTTEETIEKEATEEEITTVDTLVEDIEEFTKDDQPHQLADLIVLLKQYQKKESPEEDSIIEKEEASSSKEERATTHEKAVTTTKSTSEEEAATKVDIAIETVIETGRVVKVMETWRVVTQQGSVALGQPDGGGGDNIRSHAVSPTAPVFPSLLSWTAADSDNVVVHEHCWLKECEDAPGAAWHAQRPAVATLLQQVSVLWLPRSLPRTEFFF